MEHPSFAFVDESDIEVEVDFGAFDRPVSLAIGVVMQSIGVLRDDTLEVTSDVASGTPSIDCLDSDVLGVVT